MLYGTVLLPVGRLLHLASELGAGDQQAVWKEWLSLQLKRKLERSARNMGTVKEGAGRIGD